MRQERETRKKRRSQYPNNAQIMEYNENKCGNIARFEGRVCMEPFTIALYNEKRTAVDSRIHCENETELHNKLYGHPGSLGAGVANSKTAYKVYDNVARALMKQGNGFKANAA